MKGSAWLANPQFALSEAPGAVADVAIVASTLMASVDAMVERREAGLPDVEEDDGVPSAAAATAGAASGKKGRRARQEPEECNRYDMKSIVNGWGMGSTDSVVFKVDQDCALMGLGVFGCNSKCKIKVRRPSVVGLECCACVADGVARGVADGVARLMVWLG